MRTDDLRYRFIKDAAHKFVERHFDCIPNVLFEMACELVHNKGQSADDVLELVDTKFRECPDCDANDIERGKELDDGEHKWKCTECGESFDDNGEPWERLPLPTPDHWPGAHGTSFWTTWDTIAEHAAQCGFEVYESPLFHGIVLSIDGGGYDFYADHWVPLYLAMDIQWHKHEEGWDMVCVTQNAVDAAKAAIDQGFKGDVKTAEPFVADIEHCEKEIGRKMTDGELKHWTYIWRTYLKNHMPKAQ